MGKATDGRTPGRVPRARAQPPSRLTPREADSRGKPRERPRPRRPVARLQLTAWPPNGVSSES